MCRYIKNSAELGFNTFLIYVNMEYVESVPVPPNLDSLMVWDSTGEKFKSEEAKKAYDDFISDFESELQKELGIHLVRERKGANASSLYCTLAAEISEDSDYYIGLDFDYRFLFYVGVSSSSRQSEGSKENAEDELNKQIAENRESVKRVTKNPKLDIPEELPLTSDGELRIQVDDALYNKDDAISIMVEEVREWMNSQNSEARRAKSITNRCFARAS